MTNNIKIKKMNHKIYILLIISFTLTSCEKLLDYSPYIIDFDEENTNVNSKNIDKITALKNDDNVITIAFTGDTHREFDEFGEFVKKVNSLNNSEKIDFVVHVGDIADFGLPKQYEWGNSYLRELNMPYVVVIGNHDLVANGGDAYNEMFGEYNFSFLYDSVKFISLNTNSLEFDMNGKVPDINWLDNQLKPNNNFKKAVVLFHVAPTHGEFDSNLIDDFKRVTSKYNNVLFMVHGHMHDYSIYYPFTDSIPYVNVFAVNHNKFNVIKIKDNDFEVETYEL